MANGDSQHFWSHHFPNTFWLQNVPQANVPASTTLLELVTANMEFQIEKKWNGENCTDPPVKFHLKSKSLFKKYIQDNTLFFQLV